MGFALPCAGLGGARARQRAAGRDRGHRAEALLGLSLGQQGVPEEHLAVGVAAFRIVTFWVWIPIGWLALALVGRQSRRLRRAARAEE